MQKREMKKCLLVKELAQSKKQQSDCQTELLHREKDLEKQHQERDELRAKMEEQSRECVHLNQTKERLEADLAESHEKLRIAHLEVRSRDHLILQLRDEMKTAEQKHQGTQGQAETTAGKLKKQEDETGLLHQRLRGAEEDLKDASLQVQEQKETVAILKQKYAAAIDKVHSVQGRVEVLEEELRYSQQQLRESQAETHSATREQAELERRYLEKVGQWESSQEALDQLTDELQANQKLLRESRQQLEHSKSLMGSLQEQGDILNQQKLTLECDLRLYQQSHSRSDEEYLRLQRHRQQLQRRCIEQVKRIAECEKAILQMKSELERQ
ncbi:putative trichohyalin-like [Scophthalmus maximus]|uniref:Putative trichohyalin-like n=1 Tax=Scophthalmus maximus TaxID=52904 RepID=A0A2U9CW15_SCOMX|nr:putative trichohyalin-like [Scophthalmus maximus]